MTENSNGKKGEAPRKERIQREMIQAHRHRYVRIFRARWGEEPPTMRAIRIAFIHAVASEEKLKIDELLASRGASVEEWCPDDPAAPPPPDHRWDGVLIAATRLAGDVTRERFRELLLRAVHGGTIIGAVGRGVCLLAREGFLEGRHAAFPPEEGEKLAGWGVHPAGSPLHRDGPILTCADESNLADLIAAMLDLLKQPAVEEEETS